MDVKGIKKVELRSELRGYLDKGPNPIHHLVFEFEDGRKVSLPQTFENVIELMRAAT